MSLTPTQKIQRGALKELVTATINSEFCVDTRALKKRPVRKPDEDHMSQSNVAIVTGASGRSGRAIAEAMLGGGITSSRSTGAPDWSHAQLEPIVVDLLDPKATAQAAGDVASRHPVSHVVHNAGIIRPIRSNKQALKALRRWANSISAPR